MTSKFRYYMDSIQINHPTKFMHKMNNLRKSEILTDITLKVENKEFKAHKAVLAAHSDYFCVMFTGNMLEKNEDVIILKELSCQGFEIILDHIYTSKLMLTNENVQFVLETANYLQMEYIVDICTQFLENIITLDNCVDILLLADHYQLHEFKNSVLTFVCNHISRLDSRNGLLKLSPDHMISILKSDMPMECKELDVLRIVLCWFLKCNKYSIQKKLPYAHSILENINFSYINPENLRMLLKELSIEYDHPLNYIISNLTKFEPNPTNLVPYSKNFNIRGMRKAIVKIGGFGNMGMTNEVTVSYLDQSRWIHLTTIPHVDQCNYGVAVVNNELYVAGGCYNQDMVEIIHNYVFKYVPRCDKWVKLQPMLKDRCRFSLNSIGQFLYVTGGDVDVDGEIQPTDHCECYNIDDNSWKMIDCLPEKRTQHSAVTHFMCGEEVIFVSGGIFKERVRSDIYRYSPKADKWEKFGNLPTPRADHVMISYGGLIYVCGGWSGDAESRAPVALIEAFDPVQLRWEIVTTVENPRFHCGIILDEACIWFVGGFRNKRHIIKEAAPTLCFNLEKMEWVVSSKLPQHNWEHVCAVLYVPKRRKKV